MVKGRCLKCGKPAVWEKYSFTFCQEHIPPEGDAFDPEAYEEVVIDAFKEGGWLQHEVCEGG